MSSAKGRALNERNHNGDSPVSTAAGVKKTNAVADRLRATEDALLRAQAMIAEQGKREKELKQLLVGSGRSVETLPSQTAFTTKKEGSEDDQLQAMKTVHDSKVRALMKSINQLQEQIQSLKSQDKEHRRSALIQNLRMSQREQELLIDILKQTLVEKVPEFQESRELVNDFIVKKAVGGPLRFRPPSREELENELEVLDSKYKRAIEKLKKAKEASATPPKASARQRLRDDERGDTDDDEPSSIRQTMRQQITVEKEVIVIDPAQQEEIDSLKIDLASKNLTIHSQADELQELYVEVERLRVVEDKLEHKRDKITSLEDKIQKLQLENVRLVNARETQVETSVQLREELQFLRDSHTGDVHTSDSERLRQLELVQSLRAREEELQNQIEDQQKKWAVDRTNLNQQLRLNDKEKQLALDQLQQLESNHTALQKKHDRLFVECEGLKSQVSGVLSESDALRVRIQELDDTVALHESLTREERDAHTKHASSRLAEMEAALAEKDELAKKLDRQLTASKFLARQAKKEKDQLLERCAKLQEELTGR